jgi:hypothetical protein
MNPKSILLSGILVACSTSLMHAVDFNGHYTENFDAMGTAGTTAPTGWSFYGALGGSGSTWASSVAAADAGLGTMNATLTASTSTTVSSNTAGYNYASASTTADRCLGSSPTSGCGVVWQLSLTNTTGAALSALAIRYDTRRFITATTANELPGHWLFLSLDGGTAWTNAASLNPSITSVPNSTGTSVFAETNLPLGSEWPVGGTLLLRWIDDNALESSPDQIIGLDNVSIAKPATAPLDSALTLNTGQWATMDSAAALGATNLTLECWFRKTGPGTTTSTGTGGVTAVPLVAKGRSESDNSNVDCNYFLGINAAGQLTADFEQAAASNNGVTSYNAGQNFPIAGSTVFSNDTWYHVAATYDVTAGQWKLYVNGVAETLTVPAGSPATFAGVSPRGDSIQHFAIGTAMNSTGVAAGSFQGVIDEVRVWNVVHSAPEILASKDSQISSATPGLIGRYGFDEGSGSSLAAVPGSAPAGTLVSTPLWSAGSTFTTVVNAPPTISLVSPADNATNVGTAGNVTLEASVSDPENQPLTVTFYGRGKAPAAGDDFTIMTLPDTQFYSQNLNNRFPQFLSQTNWIVSSRDMLNTAFVAHMGDMAQSYDTVEAELVRADQAMDIIEDPATTLLTHGIPWGGAPGNHDIGSGGTTNFWNQYFGISRWAGRGYWGGNYGANNNNNYQFFSASGMDFIVINLIYNSSTTGNQAVMDWADALLKAHPDRRGIITSHWLINTGNPATWGGHGQAVYDNLKDNPNLFLMLCGHIHGEGRRTDFFEGRAVHTVLQDYQDRTDGEGGGGSWLRYFVFSPVNNTITAKTYRTATGTYETDADSEFTLSYDMGGPGPWTELGTVSASAGAATLEWTGLAGNAAYEWYAAVSDGTNSLGSATRSFNTPTNLAPGVTLDSPPDGASIAKPAAVACTATASDSDGTVAKVEFFSGAGKIGEDDTPPYEFSWTPPSGSYALSARATDNQGTATDSAVATITVTNPDNTAPAVAITQPGDGLSVPGGTVSLAAIASDTDGLVSKVEFFVGTVKLGEDDTSPYQLQWPAVSPGAYSLSAVATDNDGGTTTSATVVFTVIPVTDITFQDGIDGYAGTVDTQIRSDSVSVDISYGSNAGISIDGDDGSPGLAPNQGLIRFENIIGAAVTRIPAGSTIHSATLRLTVFNAGSGLNVHRMLTAWDESSTWNSLANGIQTDGTDAESTVIATVGADNATENVPNGTLNLNVTAAVQAWANGSIQHGLALIPLPNGTNGIDVRTSEYSVVAERPALIVNFTAPSLPEVTIAATDASAGEFGADHALEFTVTRTGSTGAPLNVPLVASGSATAGADYTGFQSSVSIPAGQASATLPLTVQPDGEAEGLETVTVTLGSGVEFTAGTPAAANAGIADKPEQGFYFLNIADPAKRTPGVDADDDDHANVIEYFMGTLPDDANSRGQLEIPTTGGNTFKVRFPRAGNRADVGGGLQWSGNLTNWLGSGQSNGSHTVTFVEAVVSAPGVEPEIIEATATITGPGEIPAVFVRLAVQ